MQFIDQWKLNKRTIATYLLSLCIVLLTLIFGTIFADALSIKFLGYSLGELSVQANLNAVLSLKLAPFALSFVALLLCIKFLHGRPALSILTSRGSFDWKRFFVAFGLWGAILSGSLLIGMAMGLPITWNFDPSTFFMLVMISVFLIPLQTAAEEVLFRGFLFQAFGQFTGKAWASILITGVLFGMLHWANPEVAKIGDILLIFYIMTGIFLGLLTHLDDGIELALGYHTINNIFAALILTNDWQAFHTDALYMDHSPPAFGWESWLTLLFLQPLLLVVFSKIYRWGNWSKKIFGKNL